MIGSPNRSAFLSMIAACEGTSTSPATRDRGYDVIVTGIDGRPETFADYSHHPFDSRAPKVINAHGLTSTASGRYQILHLYWPHYARQLRLVDFGPQSQDLYALQQLREHGALLYVDAGHFDEAIARVSGIWASLPGKAYVGQHQTTIENARRLYAQAGGAFA